MQLMDLYRANFAVDVALHTLHRIDFKLKIDSLTTA